MRLPGILVVAAGLALAACAGLTPAQQVYQLQGQLDVALEEIEVYGAQPPCDPDVGIVIACHDPDALKAAVTAADEADKALDQAEAVVRAGGTDITLYVNLARGALARVAQELAKRENSA